MVFSCDRSIIDAQASAADALSWFTFLLHLAFYLPDNTPTQSVEPADPLRNNCRAPSAFYKMRTGQLLLPDRCVELREAL